MVILGFTSSSSIQIHQVNALDPYGFKSLGYFEWVVGNDLFRRKISTLESNAFAIDQPD
jgi:hypothetical protein